jgi:undecaprenyl-diphosphatase
LHPLDPAARGLTSWNSTLLSKIGAWLSSRIEIALLAVWIALVGAIWAFLAIGSEMREGELTGPDRLVLEALRLPGQPHRAIGPHWLIESMRDLTALGGVTVLSIVTIISVIVLLGHKRRIQALVLGVCVPLAQVSSGLFKDVYERARPSFAIYGDLPTSMSFPSGHSTVATATYLILAVIVSSLEASRPMKVLGFAVAGLLSITIGFSRVYLGVHWPSDVIAGWCLGAAWAMVAAAALRRARSTGL